MRPGHHSNRYTDDVIGGVARVGGALVQQQVMGPQLLRGAKGGTSKSQGLRLGVGFWVGAEIPPARGPGKRCKLPQLGLQRSPSRQEIWRFLCSQMTSPAVENRVCTVQAFVTRARAYYFLVLFVCTSPRSGPRRLRGSGSFSRLNPQFRRHYIVDRTVPVHVANLSRREWCILNRFRSGAGRCAASLYQWGYTDKPLCVCEATQTMSHIVDSCPVYKFEGGLASLHATSDSAVEWLRHIAAYAKERIS